MISETQKDIYNLYLRAFRSNNNKPFRYRKNFDKLEDKIRISLNSLEGFFRKYPHLLNSEFFDAPYKIYKDEKAFFPLSFYASYRGFSACIAYYKLMVDDNPDNQISLIKKSLKFILEFCIDKKISFNEYGNFCSIAQNDFFKHLKEHKLCWYVVVGISDLYNKLYDMPKDEFELYFGQNISLISLYNKLDNSKKAKELIDSFIQGAQKYIDEHLNS